MHVDELRTYLSNRKREITFHEPVGGRYIQIEQLPEFSLLDDPRTCIEQIVFEIASFEKPSGHGSYIELAGMEIGGRLPDPHPCRT